MHCAAAVLSRPAALRSTLIEACLMHRQPETTPSPDEQPHPFADQIAAVCRRHVPVLAGTRAALSCPSMQQTQPSTIGPKSTGQGPLPRSHTQARPCLSRRNSVSQPFTRPFSFDVFQSPENAILPSSSNCWIATYHLYHRCMMLKIAKPQTSARHVRALSTCTLRTLARSNPSGPSVPKT